MLNLQNWELIDVYEILASHYVEKIKSVNKRLESGIIDLDLAKEVILRSNELADKFYQELQERMKKC